MEYAMLQIRKVICWGSSKYVFLKVSQISQEKSQDLLESLFNKIAGMEKSATLSKRDFSTGVFLLNLQIF